MPSNANPSTADSGRVRRIVTQVILLVGAAGVIVWLLFALRMILLLLAFTIIFCYLIAPLVEFFEGSFKFGNSVWRVPHWLAIIIVYLLLGGGIALAVDKLFPLLSEQLSAFFLNLPDYAKQLNDYVRSLATLPARYRLPMNWRHSLTDGLNATTLGVIEWLQGIAVRTVRLTPYLVWLVLIPVLGFFFLKDAKAISDRFILTLPAADLRFRVAIFLKDVSETLAAYIRAQLMACGIVGVIEGSGLWLLGLPYPLVFAVAAGLFEFVPVVGPLVIGAVAVLVASVHSWHSAFLVFAFLAIFRLIHDYLIYPRLISQGIEIHPVIVILAVLSGAELGGVLGVFLSVPVAALLIVCWRHWRDLKQVRSMALVGPDEEPLLESAIVGELTED
jgi:predicted PurR-regulated permease PerM